MSLKSQVERIKSNVATIRNKLMSFELAKSTDNLATIATLIDGIPTVFTDRPTFIMTEFDDESEIEVKAVSSMAKGYCKGGTNYAALYSKLSVSGNVATMTVGEKSISKTIGTFETWVFEMKDGTTIEKVVNVQ